ncbi:MAG: hypothetical protein OXC30_05480 [Alphaproteobacteria bacterium]|nr:hypothetical protein [Alphaproteobacteria bacterium]
MLNIIIFSLSMFVLNTNAAEDPGWFTGEAVQRDYRILRSNLEKYDITVENSMVLYICCVLSQPDCFQSVNAWVKTDINTILYTLSQKSVSEADTLAQTFREESGKVIKSLTKKNMFDALGQCVPAIHPNDMESILSCFPNMPMRFATVSNIMWRYENVKSSQRFLLSLKETLWKYVMCPEHASQDSQSDTDAAEAPVWLTSEAAKRHYCTLQSNLATYGVKVDKSIMLQVCCALLESEYESYTKICVKTDIDTIMYLLCKESSINAEKLAETFIAEEGGLQQGVSTLIDAFGRCVPEVQPNAMEAILFFVPNVCDRLSVVRNIKSRYQNEVDSERFSPALKHILSQYMMKMCPESWSRPQPIQQPMSGAFVKQCPSMQSYEMYPDCAMQSYEMYPDCAMQSYVMYPDCAYQYPPMQSYVVYPDFAYQCLQLEHQCMEVADQSQTKYLDRAKHLLAYVCRGIRPNPDSNAPDYRSYAFSEEKVDILKELPKMLDRIYRMVEKKPNCENTACIQNAQARIHQIKRRLYLMSNFEKSMIFAWAFVVERKGDRAFYDLGFLKGRESIHYLWTSCQPDLPHYLYALTECTNIENYGGIMRSTHTYWRHQQAQNSCWPKIPTEDVSSYSPEWRNIMDRYKSCVRRGCMGFLFFEIFHLSDAAGVR